MVQKRSRTNLELPGTYQLRFKVFFTTGAAACCRLTRIGARGAMGSARRRCNGLCADWVARAHADSSKATHVEVLIMLQLVRDGAQQLAYV